MLSSHADQPWLPLVRMVRGYQSVQNQDIGNASDLPPSPMTSRVCELLGLTLVVIPSNGEFLRDDLAEGIARSLFRLDL